MTVKITTEYITLGALLKFAGVAESGAQAKQIILSGGCQKEGRTVIQRGLKLYPGDSVTVDENIRIDVIAD